MAEKDIPPNDPDILDIKKNWKSLGKSGELGKRLQVWIEKGFSKRALGEVVGKDESTVRHYTPKPKTETTTNACHAHTLVAHNPASYPTCAQIRAGEPVTLATGVEMTKWWLQHAGLSRGAAAKVMNRIRLDLCFVDGNYTLERTIVVSEPPYEHFQHQHDVARLAEWYLRVIVCFFPDLRQVAWIAREVESWCRHSDDADWDQFRMATSTLRHNRRQRSDWIEQEKRCLLKLGLLESL